METDNIPGNVPEQQAAAPATQTTQQTGDGIDWKARYQGLSRTLEEKNLEFKGVLPQLEAKDQAIASSQAKLAELQTQLAAKAELEQRLAEREAELSKYNLFKEFPQLMPVMDKIEVKGTLEEQKAALAALVGLQKQEAQAQAQTAIADAMSGVTPSVKPVADRPLNEQVDFYKEQAFELAAAGKVKESEEALIKSLTLESELQSQQNGPQYGGRQDPFNRRI
jgi:hypothetical protein